jgi:GTP cyclohydrolase II
MLISHARAATLKIVNQGTSLQGGTRPEAPVAIELAEVPTLPEAMAIADPVRDLASPLKGPFRAQPLPDAKAAQTAMDLARRAGILPAFLMLDESAHVEVACTPADLAAFGDAGTLVLAARARLPVEATLRGELAIFRSPDNLREHAAMLLGTPNDSPPLVRLHSECLTGDVFGSLKCDCGPQLHGAMKRIADNGWGVLLYLRQEGRGIGLINKMRAYQLQDQGFDTVDANIRLGFPVEARDFEIAAQMLSALGIASVRLLTNNPSKVEAMEANGVRVIERVPHQIAPGPENEKYLATKRDRTGHQL